jgi:hypothetical protein
MKMNGNNMIRHDPRSRGSVYVMVLGISIIVATIGISALMTARVQHQTIEDAADAIQARENARAAIERVLWGAKAAPTNWRTYLNNGSLSGGSFADGTYALAAVDPVDGNLTDDTADPVVLTGTGVVGHTTYMLEVTLNGDGTVQSGTWKRVVDNTDPVIN